MTRWVAQLNTLDDSDSRIASAVWPHL